MNWLDNVSSDSDQRIAPACLYQGHWRHRLNPHGDLLMCRVVMDVAEPRVVAAQVIEHGLVEDLDASDLEELSQLMLAQEVHHRPTAWGFTACAMLPLWAKPTFSESQIEEMERIQGYLIDAPDDSVDTVLQLRDQFLQGIGMTCEDVHRAVRQPNEYGKSLRKGGRGLAS
ncbi:MAG: hypothetical protein C0487_14560 [Leptothrix sp. (in: Bacteria)]|nr:hypothetical protein [Leptothrix sp. (in: b-proteobacteria)]